MQIKHASLFEESQDLPVGYEAVAGSRIRALRLANGFTQTELGQLVNLSKEAVSAYESGRRDAKPKIKELAHHLGCTSDFLLGSELEQIQSLVVTFRKRASATKGEKDRAIGLAELAVEVLSPAIRKLVRLPLLNVPDLSDSALSGEHTADLLRSTWGMGSGPVDNLVWVAEAKGIEVYTTTGNGKSVDALSLWREDRPYIFLNKFKVDGARARFDTAHELAHLVMHRGLNFEEADEKQIEAEADEFASAFLLPRKSFAAEAPTVFDLDFFLKLKRRWKVSVQAMVRRCFDLGVFSEWQYRSAFQRMAALGYRSGPEPLSPPRETSYIQSQLMLSLGDRGIGPKEFCQRIGLTPRLLSSIMPELAPENLELPKFE